MVNHACEEFVSAACHVFFLVDTTREIDFGKRFVSYRRSIAALIDHKREKRFQGFSAERARLLSDDRFSVLSH